MLKFIYQKLQIKVQAIRQIIGDTTMQELFNKHRFFLAFKLLFLEILLAFSKFLVLVFTNSAKSFQVLKQDWIVNKACDYSYVNHIIYQKRIKLFSLASISAIVFSSLLISLMLIYVLPNLPFVFARTTSWAQNDWSQGADTVNFPTDPGDQTGWKKYYSKDAQTTADANSIRSSIAAPAMTDTSDADFGQGAISGMTSISNNNLILNIPQ